MSEVAPPGAQRSPVEDAPHARVPGGEFTFTDRARRLHALAAGHALSGYLAFMGRVVEAQAHAAHALAGRVTAASADHLAACIAEGRPVYPALGWARDPVWRQALDLILGRLATGALPHTGHRPVACPPGRNRFASSCEARAFQ